MNTNYVQQNNLPIEAIPLLFLRVLENSRSLRLPDFKTIGTWRW